MRWAEIQVETTLDAQDAVGNILIENECGGVAIQGEAPVFITCYLPADDRLEERLLHMKGSIRELAGFGLDSGSGEITVRYAEDKDWSEAWKQFFHTTHIGKNLVIKPTWEEYTPTRNEHVIEIDPGMAFGTGNHSTTKLCLEALEKQVRRGSVVIDFGTGSGILAIAAAMFGASLVIAFDLDEIAVKAARENVVRNNMEAHIEVHRADNIKFVNVEADIVVANLLAEIVMAEAEDIVSALRLGGTLIASGLTTRRVDEVEQQLRNVGFDIADRLTEGEWAVIVAKKGR